jgi:hypothetical protein
VPLTSVNVDLRLGPISLGGTWEPDEAEVEAAWEMYIELATRISTQPLREDEGVLREALESLYQLFATTREILRRHGPTVARKKGQGEHSFAELAVYVLNYGLRPLLAKWHPLLADHEARRHEDRSVVEHESAWTRRLLCEESRRHVPVPAQRRTRRPGRSDPRRRQARRRVRRERGLGRESGLTVTPPPARRQGGQIDIARKLTEAIWHMLTRNQPFAPTPAPGGATLRLAA